MTGTSQRSAQISSCPAHKTACVCMCRPCFVSPVTPADTALGPTILHPSTQNQHATPTAHKFSLSLSSLSLSQSVSLSLCLSSSLSLCLSTSLIFCLSALLSMPLPRDPSSSLTDRIQLPSSPYSKSSYLCGPSLSLSYVELSSEFCPRTRSQKGAMNGARFCT